jgi:hypothetical protein
MGCGLSATAETGPDQKQCREVKAEGVPDG